jgi:hydroxypyruvate isomerase
MPTTRRSFFRSSAALGAASLGAVGTQASAAMTLAKSAADPAYTIKNHHVKQSVMGWCYRGVDTMALAKAAKEIGLVGMEGIDQKFYKDVLALGLKISLVNSHGFATGPCNPQYQDMVERKLTDCINVAADVGAKKVITFTGMKYDGMDREQAIKGCLDTWKKVLPLAEQKGITLCLEHLNSRDGTGWMRGHPGYFGDDVEFCIDLVNKMGSPNFKLLFDIYHVQIMNGDVIRRLRQYKDVIGHYHTAGNPGRCELDENQEINYPAIVQAIIDTGYNDYLVQEFIPTWQDPILALRHGCMVCDV